MRKDKLQASVMRRSGMTYSEIKDQLGVPLSTLSGWFRQQKWSNDIAIEAVQKARNGAKIRLAVLNTVRGSRLRKVYEDARQDALVDYHELKFHPLFMAGVFAYWSHGDKTSKSRISFSSSDPRMVKIFLRFLTGMCDVKKISARLILREDQEEKKSLAYWCEENGLKYEFFGKTVRIKGKSHKNAKKYGVCTISLNSAYLKNKILRWIELLSEEISREDYIAGIV
jgi:hypothetical protein